MKRFGSIQIDVQRRFGLTRRGKCRSPMWLRHGSQLTFQEKCTSDVSDKRFQLAFVCFAAGEKRVHQLNFTPGKYRASLELKMDNFYRAYSDICMLDVPSAEHPKPEIQRFCQTHDIDSELRTQVGMASSGRPLSYSYISTHAYGHLCL